MAERTMELPVVMDDSVEDSSEDSASLRLHFHVQGVVQGVGFRPFVYMLATRFGLSGFVYNDSSGVYIEVEGAPHSLAHFHDALSQQRPPLAQIEQIAITPMPVAHAQGFAIVESHSVEGHSVENHSTHAAHTLVSPDISICDSCLAELFDPNDRRYRYPFINCTNCGPRFTIIENVPYDRPLTTMASFALCPDCRREYESPANRRFHAQPNACPTCGPQLEFRWSNDEIPAQLTAYFSDSVQPFQGEAALQQAQRVLIYGGIVAIKGIGGFHLACDARNGQAVARLRQLKSRGEKPFALMARDLASALQVVHADAAEVALLTSRERPIVLLRKKASDLLSKQLAPHNPNLGVMLPYSPLHHLLFVPMSSGNGLSGNGLSGNGLRMPDWLVMTSGNFADEPIVTDNEVALRELPRLADAFLLHNRAILMPCDDSVMRAHEESPLPIRRSRGYAPRPLTLPFAVPPILAVGGELKNTFCLAHDRHAFMSQHIGDMQDVDTLEHFGRVQEHFRKLFRIEPEIIACDLHPAYLSSYWADQYVDEYIESHITTTRLVKVQHHHAHIAALLAEKGKPDATPVIGFSFDGTGYGTDGAIWGGEVLIADYRHFERVAHLRYFPLPGGDLAIRHPYRTALAALCEAGIEWDELLPPVAATTSIERDVLERQLTLNLNCVPTSSMGRLFDVIATLAGVRQTITYEGQAAIELEALVDCKRVDSYHFELPAWPDSLIDASPLLRAAVVDVLNHQPPAVIATRFHNAVATLIVEMSLRLRSQRGINTVALSGGVFQNLTLLRQSSQRLASVGFEVLVHSVVPPNDGGLALGQAVVAAAQHR